MKITRIPGGPLPTNCYILTDEPSGISAVVDPGFESEELDAAVRAAGSVSAVLLTHGHFDHISGVRRIQDQTGAKIYLYSGEMAFVNEPALNLSEAFFSSAVKPFRVDVPLGDGDTVQLGETTIHVLHTPGHTAGGCCFAAGDALFSGDTLMKLSCGRTDCPTGSNAQMMSSLKRLKNLEGDYHVYPGHGPETTLDYERRCNPCMGMG